MAESPKIIKPIHSITIKCNSKFSVPLSHYFAPDDDSLAYYFSAQHPSWMHIDDDTGELYGKTSFMHADHVHKISVTAKNEAGAATQSFTVKVDIEPELEEGDESTRNVDPNLLRYLEERRLSELEDSKESVHELLEYIFEFYKVNAGNEQLQKSLQQLATDLNLPLDKDVTYKQFKDIVTTANPGIEKLLQKTFATNQALTQTALNRDNFMNAVRQGSQQLGSHPIPVWNYMGAADRVNLSIVGNVLDAAGDAVIKQKLQNIRAQERVEVSQSKQAQKSQGAQTHQQVQIQQQTHQKTQTHQQTPQEEYRPKPKL
ncbi:MAG: putative Ig domain-containing protein [Gammaproteobacteria bacterium]